MSQRYLGGIITANPTAPTLASASGVWTLEQQFQYAQTIQPEIIGSSLRFRASASAYLTRTPASTGNRQVMTFSFWMKRGLLTYSGNYLMLFSAYPGTSAIDMIAFSPSSDSLRVWFNGSASADLITTQVFRDPSAWYHVVVAIDTTQATSSNRIKVYVNGAQVTSFSTSTYPSQNYSTYWNSSSYAASIGANLNGPQSYFDGYLAETYFIDGQALTPSSFGAYDSAGVWQPLAYTGTFGTNGYYLDFSNTTSTTTLGYDTSGNGNNWTTNNFSLTAGSTYDAMIDSPTNLPDGTAYGNGNYAVLNPLTKNTASTVSNGNLAWDCSPGSSGIRASISIPASGLFYLEATAGTSSSSGLGMAFGLFAPSVAVGSSYITGVANSWGIYSDASGVIGRNGSNTSVSIIAANDVLQLAVDLANGRAWLGRNNSWYDSGSGTTGSPSTGANPTFTSLPTELLVGLWGDNTKTWVINFGQRPFTYTPPTGFKALNTANLPAATITNGAQYFAATLWTGDATSSRAINNGTNNNIGTTFKPDLVWTKARSGASNLSHIWTDSNRGATLILSSDQTAAESTLSTGVTAFNSNGFQIGTWPNSSGQTEVGWQWQAGQGANSSNTNGTITSTVSVNATAGFSIVTYTGTGANATVGHGLGAAPKLMILKTRSTSDYWPVWHGTFAGTDYLTLNTTNAKSSAATYFNSTVPTSTVFSLGTDTRTNGSGTTMVAYLWSEVAGYSKFGSYTGNGSTDGTFVYTGFRPRYVMIKASSTTGDWPIFDSSRDTYNLMPDALFADLSNAENNTYGIDFLSNGFKLRSTAGNTNTSSATYIYAAFAENPFTISRAR